MIIVLNHLIVSSMIQNQGSIFRLEPHNIETSLYSSIINSLWHPIHFLLTKNRIHWTWQCPSFWFNNPIISNEKISAIRFTQQYLWALNIFFYLSVSFAKVVLSSILDPIQSKSLHSFREAKLWNHREAKLWNHREATS